MRGEVAFLARNGVPVFQHHYVAGSGAGHSARLFYYTGAPGTLVKILLFSTEEVAELHYKLWTYLPKVIRAVMGHQIWLQSSCTSHCALVPPRHPVGVSPAVL